MSRLFFAAAMSVIVVSCSSSVPIKSNGEHGKYVVGYIFAGDTLLNGNDIEVRKMTDLNYAFANIVDGKIAPGFKNDIENFKILNKLRSKNPYLRILVSVGGWEWSGGFSDMSLTENSRERFIRSVVSFLKDNDLDGLDIDWEYPNQLGKGNVYRPQDIEDFTSLLRELRSAFDKLGMQMHKHYLISIAAGASSNYLANTQIDSVQKDVDYINLMTYDFYVPGADSLAGPNAPLFTNPRDPHGYSDDSAVQEYIDAGVSPEKIVLGIPFYGHVWKVDSASHHGLYEPGGVADMRINGSSKNLEENVVNKNGFVRYWDTTSCVPYVFNADKKIFISYDDEESVKDKCEFIKARGLKGAMFWQYISDYKSRLLNVIYHELK